MWTFFQQYTLDCDPLSGNDSNFENTKVEVYPNPTNGILYIKSTDHSENMNVAIYNILGEKVRSMVSKANVDLKELPAGTYFVRIQMNNNIATHKILKIE